MKQRVSEIMVGLLFASVASTSTLAAAPVTSAAKSVQSPDWVPVDQDVWAVLMEEPQAHLLNAQEDLVDKNFKGAADEIRRADGFFKIQQRSLAAASKQLSGLADNLDSGKAVSPKDVDAAFKDAIAALDHRQALIPVMAGTDTLYKDEADYHLARAKMSLAKMDIKAAGADIRKAEAYVKLKSLRATKKTKLELLSSAAQLHELAGRVESGVEAASKDVDSAFARADKDLRSAF